MNRRNFIKGMLAFGPASGFRIPLASAMDYRGKLFVFVQADGGWDPTSFCDPKTNSPGEPVINRWAERTPEVRQAGNIPYAPFAGNQAFFDKYYQRMLVINAVDAQTNSHEAGVVHNWSGRISEGYPTMTALLAAHNGRGLSMPYLSFGGFSNTQGVSVFTRLNNPDEIRNIARPDLRDGDDQRTPYFSEFEWTTLGQYHRRRAARLASAPNLLPRAARNRDLYAAALEPRCSGGIATLRRDHPVSRQPGAARGGRRASQQPQAAGAAHGACVCRAGCRQRGPALGRIRHALQSRSGTRVAAREPDGIDRLSVGLRGKTRSCEPHDRSCRIGFRTDEFLQCGPRKGPLANWQLRRDGKEPALDQPSGRRNRRTALRTQGQSENVATR